MKAVVLREHGGPNVLELAELEIPEPGPMEVRVKIAAVALNHLDIWVRRGGPAFRLEYPHRLGSDIAGVIDKLGPGVADVKAGGRVIVNPGLSCGRCQPCLAGADNLCRRYRILGENSQGGYAEYICVPAANIAPYPGDLSFPEAAGSILSFMTAWQMVVRKGGVTPGQTVLVHGGGSGVGVAAIQIAKLHGARVLTTAGSDEKLSKAGELGADVGINYSSEDFVARVKEDTRKRGVDVVIDHVGGEVLAKSILATARGGKIVTCGATAGFEATIDLRHIFFRQVQILGSTMAPKGDLFEVGKHLASGALRPVIDTVLPLERAADAHRLLEERRAFGKVVLDVDAS